MFTDPVVPVALRAQLMQAAHTLYGDAIMPCITRKTLEDCIEGYRQNNRCKAVFWFNVQESFGVTTKAISLDFEDDGISQKKMATAAAR